MSCTDQPLPCRAGRRSPLQAKWPPRLLHHAVVVFISRRHDRRSPNSGRTLAEVSKGAHRIAQKEPPPCRTPRRSTAAALCTPNIEKCQILEVRDNSSPRSDWDIDPGLNSFYHVRLGRRPEPLHCYTSFSVGLGLRHEPPQHKQLFFYLKREKKEKHCSHCHCRAPATKVRSASEILVVAFRKEITPVAPSMPSQGGMDFHPYHP